MAVRRTLTRRVFNGVSFAAFLGFRRAVSGLPWSGAYLLADLLALAWWAVDARHRRLALANLAIAFPRWPEGKRRRIALKSYRNLSRTLVETLRYRVLLDGRWQERIVFDRPGIFEKARERGKGVMAVSGHLGNWEWLSGHAIRYGRVHIIARAIHNPLLDREIRKRREEAGVHQIYPDRESPRKILKALRAGEALCFLVDQSAKGDEGVEVPFFGKPAPTHTGPAVLALRTGASVFSIFTHRDARNRIHIVYGEPIEVVRTGNRQRDIETNTALFTRRVEEAVRNHPDQYFWVHDRWRIRKRKRRRR